MSKILNIYRLGVKELWGLYRDPMLLFVIVYTFTVSIYTVATAMPESISMASIAYIDEDSSPLTQRIVSAFFPPMFIPPTNISMREADRGMDKGLYTFVIDFPPDFQRDVIAGKSPAVQVNVDATRMSQAFTGNNYIQQIATSEISNFVNRYSDQSLLPVELTIRNRFNPNLTRAWFGSIMEIINTVTMLSIVLTGAALIREREHGTIDHLLVMPVTPFEIMMSKVWSMGGVVLVATTLSLLIMVRGVLNVPLAGSLPLFLAGAALHLFATTSMGIFIATLARSMPQFGMLLLLVLLPMQMLSGGSTPRESMPQMVQDIMLVAPTTHFIELGQSILYRGSGIEVVWKSFAALFLIGGVLFAISLAQFRKMLSRAS